MQKLTTRLFLTALMLLTAIPVMAQVDTLTIRDINAIPADQLAALEAAAGPGITQDVIDANIFNNDLIGVEVKVTVVVMGDPRNSGLSNFNDDIGGPSRVHFFVRDTSAATLGPEGMGIQVVDGAWQDNNILSFAPGDVIELTGTVSPFNTAMQLSPTTTPVFVGTWDSFGLPSSILEPVVITSDQLNSDIGGGSVQPNFANLASLRNQFVRIENATVQQRSLASPDRPDFYATSDDGTTIVNFYDTGIQYRGDRGDYPDTFNNQEEDFVPPPPGAVINMQGFVVYQGGADQLGRGVPANDGILSVAPYERRGCIDETSGFRCDVELLESPPILADITGPDGIPDGSGPVTITFTSTPDPSRTITDNFCRFTTSENATPEDVPATDMGGTQSCDIPAQGNGVFVTYQAGSTDNTGATSLSDPVSYRTLTNGITQIEDIRLTIDEGPGPSPFNGLTVDMDITATVQTSPETSGILVVQDNADLDPWTGIFIEYAEELPELNPGDVVNITNATIERRIQFGFSNETWLTGATVEVMTTGGDILGYKSVNTDLLQDESIAAAHEGMMLRFDNVKITNNDTGFGQWAFATIDGDTTQASVQGDDVSPLIDGGDEMFVGDEDLEFIQGAWLFAFGSFRVLPEDSTDIGMAINVSNEDEALPNSFALHQNFPNPFNPTTTISYQISEPGAVVLEIFDTLGRRVATLVDGSLNAGTHTATFDATNFSSGLYLYRLKAGDNVSTRKMILLK